MVRRSSRSPRVFVDTNILIRGLTLPRFPYEVLITSVSILTKARHYIATRFPAHLERFEQFLGAGVFTVVDDPLDEVVQKNLDLVRDTDDVPVALAAIRVRARYLVSTDPDLTVEDASTANLRRQITPIRPGDFLKEVLDWTSEELSRIERRTWEALQAENSEDDLQPDSS